MVEEIHEGATFASFFFLPEGALHAERQVGIGVGDLKKSLFGFVWKALHGSLAYPECSTYQVPATCDLQKAACLISTHGLSFQNPRIKPTPIQNEQ